MAKGFMNLTKKSWLIILGVLISVTFIFIFLISMKEAARNESGAKNVKEKSPQSQTKGDLFSGMVLKIPGSEPNSYWELEVAKFESSGDSGKMIEVKGNYYLNKQVIYRLSAKTGRVSWNSRVLEVKGKVRFQSNDGKEILADELAWDTGTRILTANHNVVLKVRQTIIYSDNLKADLGLERVSFSGTTRTLYQR